MSDWKRPENIDQHPLRYSEARNRIEAILYRRVLEGDGRLNGGTLEASLEIAELFEALNQNRI